MHDDQKILDAINRINENQHASTLELKLEITRVVEVLRYTDKQLYEMATKSNFYARKEDIEALKGDFKAQLAPLADKRDLIETRDKLKTFEVELQKIDASIKLVSSQALANEKSIIKIYTFGSVLLLLITVISNLGRIVQMF